MKKILFSFILLTVNMLFAKDYALIITIGKYENTSSLKGAHQDNIIFREILKKWDSHNIVSLEDSEATRKNILYHLSSIANRIQKNDRFYMFFSGHGSSLFDELYSMKFQLAGLTEQLKDSGVILPYDFNPKKISKTILIGKRDIRPYLEEIDAKIDFGLIVFDACYSESSIRGSKAQKMINRTPNILTDNTGHPYENIVYVASSITKARSGRFSRVLESCIEPTFDLEKFKKCLDRKMDKGGQGNYKGGDRRRKNSTCLRSN